MVNWLKRLFGSKPKPTEDNSVEIRDNFIKSNEAIDEPWAMFEIIDFPSDGQIKIEFNWNDAFIARIQSLGFQAETDEDSVQLFFYASQMKPSALAEEDAPVQSGAHPALSSATSRIVQ